MALTECAGASWRQALPVLRGGQKYSDYHMQQTEEKAKRWALDVSGTRGIALSVLLVFLNMLQEDHFSPSGFALYYERSISLCHWDE